MRKEWGVFGNSNENNDINREILNWLTQYLNIFQKKNETVWPQNQIFHILNRHKINLWNLSLSIVSFTFSILFVQQTNTRTKIHLTTIYNLCKIHLLHLICFLFIEFITIVQLHLVDDLFVCLFLMHTCLEWFSYSLCMNYWLTNKEKGILYTHSN